MEILSVPLQSLEDFRNLECDVEITIPPARSFPSFPSELNGHPVIDSGRNLNLFLYPLRETLLPGTFFASHLHDGPFSRTCGADARLLDHSEK